LIEKLASGIDKKLKKTFEELYQIKKEESKGLFDHNNYSSVTDVKLAAIASLQNPKKGKYNRLGAVG
jgi:hypothetical protein